jgi:hypothetical protein
LPKASSIGIAIAVPNGINPNVVARLNRDFIAVMNDEGVTLEPAKLGIQVRTSAPEQLGERIKATFRVGRGRHGSRHDSGLTRYKRLSAAGGTNYC